MTARCFPALLRPLLGARSPGRVHCSSPLSAVTYGRVTPGMAQRAFSCTARPQSSSAPTSASEEKLTVHFINRDGERLTATANEGDSLLEVVMKQNLDIDGFGACEGTLACSTCHLIFAQNVYDRAGPISDEEMDMLDLAYGLTNTSRLGCQVCMKKSMDGLEVRVPTEVADARREGEMEQKSKQ